MGFLLLPDHRVCSQEEGDEFYLQEQDNRTQYTAFAENNIETILRDIFYADERRKITMEPD